MPQSIGGNDDLRANLQRRMIGGPQLDSTHVAAMSLDGNLGGCAGQKRHARVDRVTDQGCVEWTSADGDPGRQRKLKLLPPMPKFESLNRLSMARLNDARQS